MRFPESHATKMTHDSDGHFSTLSSSVQTELVHALVKRQFQNTTTGGEAMTKRTTSVMAEALSDEGIVARLNRCEGRA